MKILWKCSASCELLAGTLVSCEGEKSSVPSVTLRVAVQDEILAPEQWQGWQEEWSVAFVLGVGGGWGVGGVGSGINLASIVATTLVVVASGSSLVPSRSLAPHTGNF